MRSMTIVCSLFLVLAVSSPAADPASAIYPHSVSQPVDVHAVEITGGFWKQRVDQALDHGLPMLYTQYENRPIVQNFLPGRKHEGARNQDEFLYKALEAGAWLMEDTKNAPSSLREQYKRIRDIVIAKQRPDGYINTKTQSDGATPFGPKSWMDYYFAGHLMQAGIAELRATGETKLFNAARAYVDLLINTYTTGRMEMRFYGNANNQWPDHPDFETAVVELYRVTRDPKYLDFVERILAFSRYTDRTFLRHHAVQEMLFHTGAADYYLERGGRDIWRTLMTLWVDLTRQMYVTGAVGSYHDFERFGKPYDLTNQRAYAETCATISNFFWNWRMFLATGDARFVDVMERALYNGILVSPALNGHEYFYVCPLEVRKYRQKEGYNPTAHSLEGKISNHWYWDVRRQERQNCSCCPPNVQRFFASLEQYVYSVGEDTLWVNLFTESEMRHTFADGATVEVSQITDFPVTGKIRLEVNTDKPAGFRMKLRVPEWTANTPREVTLNGEPLELPDGAGYHLTIYNGWKDGDVVEVNYQLPVRLVRSHPRNPHNVGKVIIMRGPVVYCLEGVDYPNTDIFDIRLDPNAGFTAKYRPGALGGAVLIEGEGCLVDGANWDGKPYQDYKPWKPGGLKQIPLVAVPYYAWANRGYGSMLTAIPLVR